MTATEPIFDITSEREELDAMTMAALKRRYQEETGRASSTRNRQYLIRRLLWIAQAAVRGGLCDEALALAATLANDASVRHRLPAHARSGSWPPTPTQHATNGSPVQATRSCAGTRARR